MNGSSDYFAESCRSLQIGPSIKIGYEGSFIGLPNSASRPGKAGLFLPLGLAYLSAVLKNHSYKYDCIDLHTEEILHPAHSGDLWDHLHHFNFSDYKIKVLSIENYWSKTIKYDNILVKHGYSFFDSVGVDEIWVNNNL